MSKDLFMEIQEEELTKIIHIPTDLTKLSMPLNRMHIDFKVGQLFSNKNGTFANILAYKDARTDMQVLDSVVGPGGWQNEYKRDSQGVLQCGISIKVDGEWIWKWSNGTESTFEKEKGEYSDAFKRAGFMWGIGRGLYDFPSLVVTLTESEFKMVGDKPKASNRLKPNNWEWDVPLDYSKIVAKSYINGQLKERINTEPFRK